MEEIPRTGRARPPTVESDPPARRLERLPPRDPDAEHALLGSLLLMPEKMGSVCLISSAPEIFFDHRHRVLFATLVDMFEKNIPIDGPALIGRLTDRGVLEEAGGIAHLKTLIESVPTGVNAEYYATVVRDKALLRRLIGACGETIQECYESPDSATEVLDRGEKRIFDLAQQKVSGVIVPLSEVLHETFEMIDRNAGSHLSGMATGFTELDNLTSGLQRGEMIVLAARPSVGKTALAMNIVEHVGVDLGIPVAVFSLEMSKQQLAQRMLCSRSGVDSHSLRRNMLSRQDRDRLSEAVGKLAEGKIYIDDTPALTVLDLRTKARRMQREYHIEMVVIDYLQLMEAPREENRQQQISSISRGIKALARELNCPVICLSQLNRASESENRLPRTSDLRESGSIEQDADVVMLLHREAVMHRGDQEWMDNNPDKLNEAQLIIAKQRNGPCDTIKLTFLAANTRFVTWNPGYGEPG